MSSLIVIQVQPVKDILYNTHLILHYNYVIIFVFSVTFKGKKR